MPLLNFNCTLLIQYLFANENRKYIVISKRQMADDTVWLKPGCLQQFEFILYEGSPGNLAL
jgi:hypothetical protein